MPTGGVQLYIASKVVAFFRGGACFSLPSQRHDDEGKLKHAPPIAADTLDVVFKFHRSCPLRPPPIDPRARQREEKRIPAVNYASYCLEVCLPYFLGGRLNITKLGASDRAATTSGHPSP